MATISASTPTTSIGRPGLVHKRPLGASSSPILGLPAMAKVGRIRCSLEDRKPCVKKSESKLGMGASLMAAASAAVMSGPAMALVDERMSTEGTGLPFGLSNNVLGWILFVVFALIWALYFVYVGGLEEDEESGLSL
ncbi:photosystem II reaction center W protein, chloroplastic-like [Prosopis cineraria]|uniref:photosystem II reaction center W protein, chloroplastic-like n=1 Tax=Prosopis cineraria TaxID=364024 RepID=UPI0024104401|nr:photosystem II reaction center W protein, chloroplastic-like [Prosopis cineraria]